MKNLSPWLGTRKQATTKCQGARVCTGGELDRKKQCLSSVGQKPHKTPFHTIVFKVKPLCNQRKVSCQESSYRQRWCILDSIGWTRSPAWSLWSNRERTTATTTSPRQSEKAEGPHWGRLRALFAAISPSRADTAPTKPQVLPLHPLWRRWLRCIRASESSSQEGFRIARCSPLSFGTQLDRGLVVKTRHDSLSPLIVPRIA